MRDRTSKASGLSVWASEGEMEAGRGVLEERQVRDDEAVARAAEEDPDERQDQAERAEQGEQDDRGLALGRPGRGEVAAIDVGNERGADEDERRGEDTGDRRMEVGEQLLEPEEVPRRLGHGRRHVAVRQLLERGV